jgi:hypothetical protein
LHNFVEHVCKVAQRAIAVCRQACPVTGMSV